MKDKITTQFTDMVQVITAAKKKKRKSYENKRRVKLNV